MDVRRASTLATGSASANLAVCLDNLSSNQPCEPDCLAAMTFAKAWSHWDGRGLEMPCFTKNLKEQGFRKTWGEDGQGLTHEGRT